MLKNNTQVSNKLQITKDVILTFDQKTENKNKQLHKQKKAIKVIATEFYHQFSLKQHQKAS